MMFAFIFCSLRIMESCKDLGGNSTIFNVRFSRRKLS